MTDQTGDQDPPSQPIELHPLAKPMEEIVDAFIQSPEFAARLADFKAKFDQLPSDESGAADKDLAATHFRMAVTKPICSACCANLGYIPGSVQFKTCVNQCMTGSGPCASP